MPIVTANMWFGASPVNPTPTWEAFLAGVVKPYCARNGLLLIGIRSDQTLLKAYVHQGRWVASCPNPNCKGVERVWEEGWFFCLSCMNAQANHHLLGVGFPAERLDIEAVLEYRPVPNRSWYDFESVQDLVAENLAHGLPVPPGMKPLAEEKV